MYDEVKRVRIVDEPKPVRFNFEIAILDSTGIPPVDFLAEIVCEKFRTCERHAADK